MTTSFSTPCQRRPVMHSISMLWLNSVCPAVMLRVFMKFFMSSREILYQEKCNHDKNIFPWQADNKSLSLLIHVGFSGFSLNNFHNKASPIFEYSRGISKCSEFTRLQYLDLNYNHHLLHFVGILFRTEIYILAFLIKMKDGIQISSKMLFYNSC